MRKLSLNTYQGIEQAKALVKSGYIMTGYERGIATFSTKDSAIQGLRSSKVVKQSLESSKNAKLHT